MTASAIPTTSSAMASRGRGDWRNSILYLCLVTMEAIWIGSAVQVWFRSAIMEDPLPMPLYHMIYIVLGNALFGLFVRRTMITLRIDFVAQRIPVLIGGFVSMLATVAILPTLLFDAGDMTLDFAAQFDLSQDIVPGGIIIAPIALISYSRGSSSGRYPPAPEAVAYRGRFGIAMLFLSALFGGTTLQEDMTPLLPLFFSAMLLTSALSRAATLRISSDTRRQRFGGSWFSFLLLVTLGVTLASVLVAALFGGIDEEQVQAILAIPFTVLIAVIVIIVTPFGYVVGYVLGGLDLSEDPPQEEEAFEGVHETQPAADNPQIDIGDELNAVVNFVGDSVFFFVLAFSIGLAILFWITVFLMPDSQALDDEDSEDIEDREGLGNVGNTLGKQLKKLGKALSSIAQTGLGGDLFATFTIRWAYARMERMGKRRGFPRGKSQTPYEYQTRLQQAFPGGNASIRTITDAYVAIRYGELPERDNDLEAVRTALDQLKTIEAPK